MRKESEEENRTATNNRPELALHCRERTPPAVNSCDVDAQADTTALLLVGGFGTGHAIFLHLPFVICDHGMFAICSLGAGPRSASLCHHPDSFKRDHSNLLFH